MDAVLTEKLQSYKSHGGWLAIPSTLPGSVAVLAGGCPSRFMISVTYELDALFTISDVVQDIIFL